MSRKLDTVSERPSFPDEERQILDYWKAIDAFKTSYEQSKGKPLYTFYDGPPFATGTPHYGHILAGTIKDVVTRYAHQTGHCVERRFGWDCHGLPVEHEIDNQFGIKSREDVLAMGIANYNEECRKIVMRYSSLWQTVVERLGRWVDFENDYKTMHKGFMESVWWVFKTLFEKKLVYRGFKVMPYSTGCSTPLSNFEANLNYKDVLDPSIVITFPLVSESTTELLVWTTTPWTLPANLAVCAHPAYTYLKVRLSPDAAAKTATGNSLPMSAQKLYIVCKERLQWFCSEKKLVAEDDITVVATMIGSDLKGLEYVPLFEFYATPERKAAGTFKVVTNTYVTDDTGTGLVHMAPTFGEDDYKVCTEYGLVKLSASQDDAALQHLRLPQPIDDSGTFTSEVPQFAGTYVKKADKDIRACLRKSERLVVDAQVEHKYPHCWRSDTPLLYRAVPSWFVNVESIKDRLIECNKQSYWVPNFVKEKRFHNWLCDARDWCVSRNRFWGTPLPLWTNSDFSQVVCIGSVDELTQLANRVRTAKGLPAVQLDDIHRHFIDDIEIPDPRGDAYPPLRRVDEVFDCWFESGSMPYAQIHYPFENQDKFNQGFPADFIAEGLDQTRGWFYTLMVLSTALFDKPAFKNNIVNGLVLAADGKKMSKRLKNYPDPTEVVDKHGADALRLYLVNSPVVRAESLKFTENGVKHVVRDVLLPWYHAYRFFVQEVERYENTGKVFVPSEKIAEESTNVMDCWIFAATQSLIVFFHEEMQHYRLYTVAPRLVKFLDQLTNWYVRLNRDRMRGQLGEQEVVDSLNTLYSVLFVVVRLMCPLTPFMSELIYKNLKRKIPEGHEDLQESVHYLMLPKGKEDYVDAEIETAVERMQAVISLSRTIRERRKVGLKTPLMRLTVVHPSPQYTAHIERMQTYIKDEVNVMELNVSNDISTTKVTVTPDFPKLGKTLGQTMKTLTAKCKAMTADDVAAFLASGSLQVDDHEITLDDVVLKRGPSDDSGGKDVAADGDHEVLVALDFTADESLQHMALAREVSNRVQKLRKAISLRQDDEVLMYAYCSSAVCAVLKSQSAYMEKCLKRPLQLLDESQLPQVAAHLLSEMVEVDTHKLTVVFVKGKQ